MESALVTGGAGFIGSNLVHALMRDGVRVRVLDDLSTGRSFNLEGSLDDLELIDADLRDPDAVQAATRGVSVVFHLGAIPSVARSLADPRTTHDVNVTGTLNVLLAARDGGCKKVVFASSSAVYGEHSTFPLHEGLICRPISPYGVSKLAGERYLQAFQVSFGLPSVALRFFNVFGPRQDQQAEYAAVVPRFIARTLAREPVTIYGDGEQARDFVFVDDVVRACVLAADSGTESWGGAFNVARGERHSVNELASTIAGLVGGDVPPPSHVEPRLGDVRESYADLDAAGRVLGYSPQHSLRDGLRLTVDRFAQDTDPGSI